LEMSKTFPTFVMSLDGRRPKQSVGILHPM